MKAKNFFSAGVVLAMVFTFSCSSSDDDSGGGGDKGNDIGNYKTVVIGTQTWMAENLNYAVAGSKCYGEGGEVAIGYDEEGVPTSTTTLSMVEVQANCDKYGRLYDWATAMALPPSCNENSCSNQIQPKHKGICPSGWHIPSSDDFVILIGYVGETSGTKLKTESGWNENGNGTNEFGFSALPGGVGSGGYFGFVGNIGLWWCVGEGGSDDAYIRINYDGNEIAHWNSGGRSNLFSVRCLKD